MFSTAEALCTASLLTLSARSRICLSRPSVSLACHTDPGVQGNLTRKWCADEIPKVLLEDRALQLTETLGPKVGPVEIQNLIGHVRGQMELTGKLLAEQSPDSDSETDLDEVNEYAKYLGMDVDADPELLFIAAYAMEADVPADWTACLDASGKEYFCNLNTGNTQYQHPMDAKYIKMYQNLKAKKTGSQGRRGT